MAYPALVRYTSRGVTLIGDVSRPFGVSLAFTERTGGVSEGPFASLNLGDAVGDDADAVKENRRRALAALGVEGEAWDRLVVPRQVHGDTVVTIAAGHMSAEAARQAAAEGADAIVCTERGVPALICVADCVPVILAVPYEGHGAFAVIHSGWRGTIVRIAGKALNVLLDVTSADTSEVFAYVGPHIGIDDYEVSVELADAFRAAFVDGVVGGARNLDLGAAVVQTLEEAGVVPDHIVCVEESSAAHTERFFSYRKEGPTCGRLGGLAYIA